LEETKLIRKELLSIFLMAKLASVGIFGLCLIISRERSLIESIMALNSSLLESGFSSGRSEIVALR
jgi:hypothetical protein